MGYRLTNFYSGQLGAKSYNTWATTTATIFFECKRGATASSQMALAAYLPANRRSHSSSSLATCTPATWPVTSYLKLLAVLLKNYSYALLHLVYLYDDSPWQGLLFIIHTDTPAVHLMLCNDYTFPIKKPAFSHSLFV